MECGMLAALTDAIEARDPYTRGHSARVAELAVTLGETLGWARERLDVLHLGGLLHDVGKLAIAAHVLSKPEPLDPDELAAVRSHPVVGVALLEAFPGAHPVLECVLFHHERWDGTGYPTGRAGGDIPIEARVLAVADAYDAMTTTRPYRRALGSAEARIEIARCAGTQFDPMLAVLFVELWDDEVFAAAAS
jgi:putative nucleotidyltransferase with HDIG domain